MSQTAKPEYVLIGRRIYGYGHEDEETNVALFSSEKAVKEYIEASYLKNYKRRWGFARRGERVFRANSLLSGYQEAYWDYWEGGDLPVDPKPPKATTNRKKSSPGRKKKAREKR